MAEQPATDQSSTPAPATAGTPPAPAAATHPVAASTTPDSTATPATDTPTPDLAAPKADTAVDSTDKPAPVVAPAAPLYTAPEDLKLPAEMVTAFDGFLKSKVADGKVSLTPQEVVDQFAALSRISFQNWQAQIKAQDTANAAACKAQYTSAQLAAAESAVALLEGKSPGFREVAKNFLNDPTFVGAMALIGDRISEDTFLTGATRPSGGKKTLAQALYGKSN